MTTRADRYSLHYRTTKIERMLGIVNKWTSLPEGADIYTTPPRPDAQSDAEPVKYEYRRHKGMGNWIECGKANYNANSEYEYRALYTAPPRPDYELSAIAAAIGSNRFMDPPDGGDVSLAEQVCRMREALEKAEAALAGLIEAFRKNAEECYQAYRETHDPAEGAAAEAYNECADALAADRSGK